MSDRHPSATAHLRRQHETLTAVAVDLLSGLDPEKCASQARALRDDLAVFTGRLKAHTSMEEQQLYPMLRAHGDPEVRALAERMWSEFGEVYADYFRFFEQWTAVGAIEEDPEGFIDAVKKIMMRLALRMKTENEVLYDAVDHLDPA